MSAKRIEHDSELAAKLGFTNEPESVSRWIYDPRLDKRAENKSEYGKRDFGDGNDSGLGRLVRGNPYFKDPFDRLENMPTVGEDVINMLEVMYDEQRQRMARKPPFTRDQLSTFRPIGINRVEEIIFDKNIDILANLKPGEAVPDQPIYTIAQIAQEAQLPEASREPLSERKGSEALGSLGVKGSVHSGAELANN